MLSTRLTLNFCEILKDFIAKALGVKTQHNTRQAVSLLFSIFNILKLMVRHCTLMLHVLHGFIEFLHYLLFRVSDFPSDSNNRCNSIFRMVAKIAVAIAAAHCEQILIRFSFNSLQDLLNEALFSCTGYNSQMHSQINARLVTGIKVLKICYQGVLFSIV